MIGRHGHGEARGTSLVAALSALTFGIVWWCAAHALTHAWFAHSHPGANGAHHHGFLGPLAAAALTLSIAAIVVVVARVGAGGRPAILLPVTALRRASPLLAPAAFVAVEFAEHAGSANPSPPAALLLVGSVLHALAGAVSPLLWQMWLEDACRCATVAAPRRPVRRNAGRVRSPRRGWTAGRVVGSTGSRAPPAGARAASPSSLPGSA